MVNNVPERRVGSASAPPFGPYPSFLRGPGFRVFALVVHDQLTPMIARYPTRDEILEWCRHEDLPVEHLDMRTRNSWRAGLRKRVNP